LFYIFSDSDHSDDYDDEILQNDSTTISTTVSKRHVSFLSKKKNSLNGKSSNPTSPTTPTASTASPVVKMRRQRLRTISRSGDDRILFRGQNPIYTAGIQNQISFLNL
jgi:hypothetical protein